LGHATRSAPIVKKLEEVGHEVILASSGESATWLETELGMEVIVLPDYRVHYKGRRLWASILRQTPGFLRAITQERKAVEEIVHEKGIDLIISDNRYGCYCPGTPSIFMGHQLVPPVPILRNLLARWHARFIDRFDHCWILDSEESRIAGKMSDPKYLGTPHTYVGFPSPAGLWRQDGKKICIILSGPEPHRTKLEQELCNDPRLENEDVALVRGTKSSGVSPFPRRWEVYDLVDHKKLAEIVHQSQTIVSRSGYSSVWNYLQSGLGAILIPTPGQFEQMYLGDEMKRRGLFDVVQEEKELGTVLGKVKPMETIREDFQLPDLSDFFQTEAKS
jgi:UDP:flavonoid glycosyltransferase YjiC (YdhE family)